MKTGFCTTSPCTSPRLRSATDREPESKPIIFTLPLWVCAISVPLLGEHVGLRRLMAVLVGFVGVMVIMRPGSMDFH